MYLIIELTVHDAAAAQRYGAAVLPLVERFGGRILAFSTTGGEMIEGEPRPVVFALHRWPDRATFDAFYDSPEYEPLKRLRHEACETRIIALQA